MSVLDLVTSHEDKLRQIYSLVVDHEEKAAKQVVTFKEEAQSSLDSETRARSAVFVAAFELFEADLTLLRLEVKQLIES